MEYSCIFVQYMGRFDDMSESKKVFLEKRALEPVPIGERQHWMSVTLIQAGFMISATSLWTGSIMAAGMSLLNTVVAAVIGYVIIVGICTVQGIMGSDLGVPSIVAATSSFGDSGVSGSYPPSAPSVPSGGLPSMPIFAGQPFRGCWMLPLASHFPSPHRSSFGAWSCSQRPPLALTD